MDCQVDTTNQRVGTGVVKQHVKREIFHGIVIICIMYLEKILPDADLYETF